MQKLHFPHFSSSIWFSTAVYGAHLPYTVNALYGGCRKGYVLLLFQQKYLLSSCWLCQRLYFYFSKMYGCLQIAVCSHFHLQVLKVELGGVASSNVFGFKEQKVLNILL